MSRFKTLMNTACLLAGVCFFSGCYGTYSDLVDPCYPERYNCKSREAVQSATQMQELNGLALEHTVFNYHFKDGTDELLPIGQAHISRLAHRTPAPEQVLYVQAARDVVFDSAKPDEYAAKRKELNDKRVAAVRKFLAIERSDVAMAVELSHPTRQTYISGREAAIMMDDIRGSARGTFLIPGFTGGGNAGGGAGAPGSSGGDKR